MTADEMTALGRVCVAAGLMLAASCGGAGREAYSRMTLAPCAERAGLECGAITVFEDRAAGRGRTLEIAFEVARAEKAGAREALFVFAGGPGEGSTDLAGSAFGWLQPVRASLDIVFVDQRGTGRSHPLACASTAAADPASAFAHVFDPATVMRCRDALGRDADLTQYTTDAAVADVDDVRAALGYERVSLYGGSYGTRMAQAYMRRFPSRARSAVLDGVVPFDNAIPLTYAASAQQSLDLVWAACARTPACAAAHPHPADAFNRILRRLDNGPAPATVASGAASVPVRMSRGAFGYAVRGMLYGTNLVSRLPGMVERADASGDLGEFADAYWSREVAMDQAIASGTHLSVFCAEDVPYPTDAEISAATAGTFLGRYLIDEYRAACRIWPRGRVAADARTPVTVRVPTLLVSGAFDPVTPPAFADLVARSLPLALAVTAPTGSHGSATGCPQAAALYVLARGTLQGVPDVCR